LACAGRTCALAGLVGAFTPGALAAAATLAEAEGTCSVVGGGATGSGRVPEGAGPSTEAALAGAATIGGGWRRRVSAPGTTTPAERASKAMVRSEGRWRWEGLGAVTDPVRERVAEVAPGNEGTSKSGSDSSGKLESLATLLWAQGAAKGPRAVPRIAAEGQRRVGFRARQARMTLSISGGPRGRAHAARRARR
jgi:hypothetical protein